MNTDVRPLWIMASPDRSGMSIANSHLAAGMARLGRKPEIFALRDGENAADFRQIGCALHVFPHLGTPLFGGAAPREAARLGVNIVHALSVDMVKRAERVAKRLEAPLLVTSNRLDEAELQSLSGFRGHGVIAVSRALHERIVNVAGIPQRRIRVIHNGLDLTRLPRPPFLDGNRLAPSHIPVIGTFGHLSAKKGQRVFLQAVKILLERGLDAEFVILGDGPDRSALRDLAGQLRVERRVTFTPQTVTGQISQLDILIEPSLQEGLGMSVMQAMAGGIPVIATGVGGLYDLIEDGVTGVMIPPSDPEALAGAIWNLLNNSSLRLELARQARDRIERDFSAERAAEAHFEYYAQCRARFNSWSQKESVREFNR